MMVLITSVCCEGSDEPACTHDLDRAFASRINNMQVEEDSKLRLLEDFSDICGKTKSRVCVPFSHDPDT